MKELKEYCHHLLIMHDCIIIPGFGAMIARNIPSYYCAEHGKFYPPSREITFNRNITKDDGLLTHHVSILNQISFGEARTKVMEWSKLLERTISGTVSFDFGVLGTFYKQKDGNIVFEPFSRTLISPWHYGLPAISISQTDEYRKRAEVNAVIVKYTQSATSIIAGFALFIALGLIPLQVSRQSLVQQQKALISVHNNSIKYSAGSRDSISTLIDEMTLKENAMAPVNEVKSENNNLPDTQKEITESTEVIPVTTEDAKPVIKSGSGYYLIAGSFVEMWRAEKYINEIKQKGFDPIIVNSDNKLRIAVDFSEEKSVADNKMSEFRSKHPEMQVWLLKK